MPWLRVVAVSLGFLAFTACSSNSSNGSPTAPSASAAVQPVASQPAAAVATITGALNSGTAALAQGSDASSRTSPVQFVGVVGTSVTAPVDGSGRFTLTSVPAGAVQLRFTGPGTDATLPVGAVQSGETITLVVSVSGPLAMIVTDSRNPNAAQIPLNGEIDTLTGSAASFAFKIGSRQIRGDSLTAFFGDGDRPDSFASLHEGSRVEVKALQREGFFYAFRIHVNGTEAPEPTPNPNPPTDTSASIEGTLTSLGGAPPALQLVVGGTAVTTNADTVVQRRGDRQDLSTLSVGMTLHVVGDRQRNGSILARFIQIRDDQAGGEVEIEGSLGGMHGSCPSDHLRRQRLLDRGGNVDAFTPACGELRNGNKIRVRGTRLANGDVQATSVTRQ